MTVWKTFEQSKITHSVAHHLMAINDLIKNHGYARVTDVARYLKISKGSTSNTLKNLKQRDLIQEDDNKFYQLTEKGYHITETILAKHSIILKFLTKVLQVDKEQAEIDACKIEHLLSNKSSIQILFLLQFMQSNEVNGESYSDAFKKFQNRLGDVDNCDLCADACMYPKFCNEEK